MPAGRGVDPVVGLQHILSAQELLDRSRALFIEIEIEMPDLFDIVPCASDGFLAQGVHGNVDVAKFGILMAQPYLEIVIRLGESDEAVIRAIRLRAVRREARPASLCRNRSSDMRMMRS